MTDLFNLLKFKDKNNCWLCNSFTKIDSNTDDYFFCQCDVCLDFDIEIYLKEISIIFYDVIDFGDKLERTGVRISLSKDKDIVNISIDHESGSDRTNKYNHYDLYGDKISVKQFKKLNIREFILKIIDNYKKNLLFI